MTEPVWRSPWIKASAELTCQPAPDEVVEEWVKMVQKPGIDSQKRQYKNVVDGARALGYKI
jgi:hypothetical protein